MANLSEIIEHYIKKLFEQSAGGFVELQRNELAELFDCVPSQINYVLATRFTLDKGYMIESRRGGGGFVRIVRMALPGKEDFFTLVRQTVGEEISLSAARGLIEQLFEKQLVNAREGRMLLAAVNIEGPDENRVRAKILQNMLFAALRPDKEGGIGSAL